MTETQSRQVGVGAGARRDRALAALKRQTGLILSSIGEGIHALDAEGRVLIENPAAEAMFGRTQSEMIGQKAHALIHHHRADGTPYPAEECPIHKTLRDGVARSVEGERFYRADGSSFPVDYLCSPMLEGDGRVVGAVVTFRDVSEREEAERALRNRESLLSNAQRIANMGSWEHDVLERRLVWSEETHLLFGVAPGQFAGTVEAYRQLILPEDLVRVDAAHVRAYAAPDGILEVEYRIRRPDGEVRWLAERGMVERDATGHPTRLLGMVMDVTRQKVTEWALRVSEDRLRRMFLEAATGIAITSGDGRILDVNAAYSRSLGYREEELREADLQTLLHPEDRAWMWKQIAALSAGERPNFVSEVRLQSRSGAPVWHRASVSAQRDDAGRLLHLIVMAEDITEARLVAEELERSQAMRRMATRVSHLGGYVVDLQTLTTFMSDEACALHGVPPGFLPTVEQGIAFYAPEHRERIRGAFETCIREGVPFDLELELLTAHGSRIWVRAIGEAARDASGAVVRVEGAIQDISERRRAEQALRESEQRFRQLADAMPLIVWTADPDGRVDYASRTFTEYTGVGEEELPGQGWVHVLHPEDLEGCIAAWAEAVRTGTHFSIEYRIRRASDGAYRWHLVRATPVRDAAGRIVRWYGTAIEIHDRKLAEREASIQAAQLTATLESITDVFFTVDQELRFSFVNAEAERMLQRPREALIGAPLASELPADFARPLERLFLRALETREPVEFEEFFPPLKAWLSGRAYPSPHGLAVYLRDVTEMRASREALRTSDERFQLLSRATHDALWDWEAGSNSMWCNERFEHLVGQRPVSARGTLRMWRRRLHPDDAKRMTAVLRSIFKGDTSHWSAEYRFRTAEGKEANVFSRGHVIRDDQGRPVRFLGGFTDLSARKQAEERLAEQAALLDAAHEPIIVCDLEDRVRSWSKGAERTYGWTEAEVLGQPMTSLFPNAEGLAKEAWPVVLEAGEWHGESTRAARDGRLLHVDVRWTLLRDAQGRPKGVLAIHADITERKNLEQQILRTQRMESIGTLAGGIAHDLNNLLAPIMVSIAMLRDGEANPQRLEDLETLQACARRGADLVRQLLSFARGAEGRRVEVDLATVAGEVGWLVRDTFPKNIDFRLRAEHDLWVLGDPTQLHQVMVNLCVNARDAMPRGGTLELSIDNVVVDEVYAQMKVGARPGPYVLLKVEDTGTGIPRSVLDRIFEPFFTTKEVGKGTGLGLSTTHAIVRSHGGFIDVSSEPGHGTRFHVYLPADPELAPPAERSAGERAELPRGNGELVLVVDDEAPIRTLIQRTLLQRGYRVLLAAHGAEAVALYAQHRHEVAAVLTDMQMPVMDGAALVIALRSMNPSVRVIGSSGLDPIGELAKLTDFISKPYTTEALLGSLQRALAA